METLFVKVIFLNLICLDLMYWRVSGLATKSEIPDKRQAAYASTLSSYEIITPSKVTQSGSFISNEVSHMHSRRHKRDTKFGDDSLDFELHYIVPIEGRDHKIRLRPNSNFIAKSVVIEKRSAMTDPSIHLPKTSKVASNIQFLTNKHKKCHFTGDVHDHHGSSVAVSTCDGLIGYVRTATEDYFIEPVKGHNRTYGEPHPHIVYRRSALAFGESDSSSSTCGTKDSYMTAFKERDIWERKRKEDKEIKDRVDYSLKSEVKSRTKRSTSLERNVEVMVAADKEMIDYYSNEDINTYILTVMNMVYNIFRDASIGNAVNIIVVRIILLETPNFEEELSISHDADSSLQSFCKWQQKINPVEEEDPYHHDVAVLLTRHNICSQASERCSTLGLAEISGMCQPHRSCNVNEDTGLHIAYTVAHEIGHNFGMNHDSLSNGCGTSYGVSHHVMSPHMSADAIPITWSNCSRKEITYFLDREWGSCLVDAPTELNYTFPTLPPGAMYDAGHQCRLAYGPLATHCNDIELVCETLWCNVNDRCVTKLEGAAEGTNCGKHKWCIHGKCVAIGDLPPPIHGSWGEWSEWSTCSRTCGAGISVAMRECNNPFPANGGEYCTGDRRKYKICNSQECLEENGISFRAIQCSHFDHLPYKGKNTTWTPVTLEQSPCELNCKPDNEFFSVELKQSVIDGTPCNPGTRDMCIHGVCKRVACDWTIEGEAQEDRCGLCHGDGTQCVTTRGVYNVTSGVGYKELATFPKGARNIRVEEEEDAANYLAIKDKKDGKFYLNGNWIIQWSGEYSTPGAMLYYKREDEKETIFIPGPIRKDLTLMLLFQTTNDGVSWEYTLPQQNVTYIPVFAWSHSDWSICTRTCGSGMHISRPQCMEQEAGHVEDKYCDPESKPSVLKRACNTHSCPSWWWSGPWQPCSTSCGDGTRRRTVICVRFNGTTEHFDSVQFDSDCDQSGVKPDEEETCPDTTPCPTDLFWDVGPWQELCKGDPCEFDHRTVKCLKSYGDCDSATKPTDVRQCSNITCGTWDATLWSPCSASTGEGVQIRKVYCVGGYHCVMSAEPHSVRECLGSAYWKNNEAMRDRHFNGSPMDRLISEVERDSTNRTLEKIMDVFGKNKITNTIIDEKESGVEKVNEDFVHPKHPKKLIKKNRESDSEKVKNKVILQKPPDLLNSINLNMNKENNNIDQISKSLNPTTLKVNNLVNAEINDVTSNDSSKASDELDESTIPVLENTSPMDFDKQSIIESAGSKVPNDIITMESPQSDSVLPTNSSEIKPHTIDSIDAVETQIKIQEGASTINETGINTDKTLPNNVTDTTEVLNSSDETNISSDKNNSSDTSLDYYEAYDSIDELLNKTHIERSFESVKDDLGLNDLQMIEISEVKIKPKFPKKYMKNRWNKRKRVKIHTGEDAFDFLNEVVDEAQDYHNFEEETENKEPSVYYRWAVGDWSKCDSPCEGGIQARAVECYEMPEDIIMDPHTCPTQAPVNLEDCNIFPCANWTISKWSDCSVTCNNGSRHRNATCQEENRCHPKYLPQLRELCVMEPCVKWVVGPWSMCNRKCGKGYQIRSVKCVDSRTQERSKECTEEKPRYKRDCNSRRCRGTRKRGQQRRCRDHLTLCKRLVDMCSTKYFSLKCCKTCRRKRRG